MNANIDEAHYPEPQFEHVPSIKVTIQEPGAITVLISPFEENFPPWIWSAVIEQGATVTAKYPHSQFFTWEPN